MTFNLKSRDTSPIQTNLKDSLVAGANLATNSSFPTKIHDEVYIPKRVKSLSRLFLTKSAKGIIGLHQLTPVIRVSHRIINNKPQISRNLYFIAISCNKNEFDSNMADVHIIKDSTVAMLERGLEDEAPYNGFSYNGSPSTGLIPRNAEAWNSSFQETTLGEYSNKLTLQTFYEIKHLQAQIDDPEAEVEEEVVTQTIKSKWDAYQEFVDILEERGALVMSDFAYVDASSMRPIITCFQDTTSQTQKYLNANFMFGSVEAGASYAPEMSMVTGLGIITATQAEPDSGYQYGQFSVNSRRNEITTVPEDQKKTTLESCTREIAVSDSSGRNATMQFTVNDIAQGQNPIKRSSYIASVPVGTLIAFTGKLQVRSKGIQGSYAVNFRVTNPTWEPLLSNSNTSVNTDVTSDEVNIDLENINFDELQSFKPQVEEEAPTAPSEPQVEAAKQEEDAFTSF